jgi:predicted alpha-1,2-mannosidase
MSSRTSRRRTLLLALLALPAAGPGTSAQVPRAPLDAVDVFIGTSNSRWMLFPGPTVPFGLVKLSPDNQGNVWNGGYEWTISSISGFQPLHAMSLSGPSLMPTVGPLELYPGQLRVFPGAADGPYGTMWTAGLRSRIRKEDEHGAAGSYAVRLVDYGIDVALAATARSGLVRMKFPQSREAHLVLDLDPPTEEKTTVREAFVRRSGPGELEGSVRQSNQYAKDLGVHFVLRLDRSFDSLDAWQTEPYAGADTNYGTAWRAPVSLRRDVREWRGAGSSGVVLNFTTRQDETVLARLGVSLVSLDGARANLDSETAQGARTFEAAVASARGAWDDILGRVEVEGGPPGAREMFYTFLYRAYSGKSLLQDVGGRYRDMCGREQSLPAGGAVYSSDGLWGAQWTLFPLWTLLTPRVAQSWVGALLESAERGGWISEAPVAFGYAPIMVAQHQQSLIVSAWQKGIRGFDGERAWRAIEHDLTTPGVAHACGGFAGDRQLEPYLRLGYVPEEAGPVSNTLEYAFDDWAASQLALALGKRDAHARFLARSRSWRNVLDPKTGFVRRRHADGRWLEPFDPFRFGTEGGWNGPGYVEGNAWLYTFFVPHDVPGLVAALGADEFNRRLEEGFEQGHVDLGNQPNLQAPILFNYSGRPWLAQKHAREVLARMFDATPLRGWAGEEDEGQLSALFVLLSMGLFEMDGGCAVDPGYDLASPLFDRVTLHLDPLYGGRTFTIEARGNSPANVYVQSATLDGRPLREPRLRHADLVHGGRLVLEMGPRPGTLWGRP